MLFQQFHEGLVPVALCHMVCSMTQPAVHSMMHRPAPEQTVRRHQHAMFTADKRAHAYTCGDTRLLAHYSFVAAVHQQHAPAVHVAHSRRGEERRAAVAAGTMTTMYNKNDMIQR